MAFQFCERKPEKLEVVEQGSICSVEWVSDRLRSRSS